MDNVMTTDDDDQTSSNEQSSTDDITSMITENVLSVDVNDQQRLSGTNNIRVCSVKVDGRNSLSNLNIKHPYVFYDYDNDPINDEKKRIIDEHVKVFHIKRSSLVSLNTEISLLRLDSCSRRKSTGYVNQMASSRESTVRVNHISTAASKNQDSSQKEIGSKPLVTRLPLPNELSFKNKKKEVHVSVKHISVNSKKSS